MVVAVMLVAGTCVATVGAESPPAAAAGTPVLSIGDVRAPEGNSGTQVVHLPVVLSEPAAVDVTATYVVTGDTAQTPSDWLPTGVSATGTARIRAGGVVTSVRVKLLGDTAAEPDESLHVVLSNVSGATLAPDDTGTATILDDDTAPAVGASVGDVVMPEGDTKNRPAKVPIVLSQPSLTDVYISFTHVGTATRTHDDKLTAPKTLRIRAGRTTGILSVPIVGDRLRERDETVELVASSTDVALARATATITIRDETSDAGPVFTSAPTDDTFYTPPAAGTGPPGELVWSRAIYTSPTHDAYLVMYRSIGERARPIFVTGRVFVPTGPEPLGGRDVVAWAEGTTGMADACAASLTGYGVPALTALVGAGYVVVSTDYEGSGTPGAHAYLMARSEAQTVYDSIRAVTDLGVNTSGRAVVYGGSRGGHAAIATAERTSYAPDVELRGALGLGAGAVTPDDASAVDPLSLSPYRGFQMMYLRGVQQLYGAGSAGVQSLLSYYLTPTGIAELPNADGCNATVLPYFGLMSASTLFNLVRGPIPTAADVHRQEATVGALGNTVPIALMSGLADPIVTPSMIDAWHTWACAQPGRSAPIEKLWYSGGHFPTPTTDITNWIAARFAGTAAGESCP
jgi:hypothetical protein